MGGGEGGRITRFQGELEGICRFQQSIKGGGTIENRLVIGSQHKKRGLETEEHNNDNRAVHCQNTPLFFTSIDKTKLYETINLSTISFTLFGTNDQLTVFYRAL